MSDYKQWADDSEHSLNPVKRVGAMLTGLTNDDLDILYMGLAHAELYQYVDVTELRNKLDNARAQLRQESS